MRGFRFGRYWKLTAPAAGFLAKIDVFGAEIAGGGEQPVFHLAASPHSCARRPSTAWTNFAQ
jgi:hypothetical protein